MSDWENDFFNCCETRSECLMAFLCPGCFAYKASQAAGQNPLCGIYQCILFPFCVPFLRKEIRLSREIKVSI